MFYYAVVSNLSKSLSPFSDVVDVSDPIRVNPCGSYILADYYLLKNFFVFVGVAKIVIFSFLPNLFRDFILFFI